MENELLEMFLGGRTVVQVLTADAIDIKKIGESTAERTYAAKQELGYVTAKILPVLKDKAAA